MADQTFTITIPEAQTSRVVDGIVYQHGYQDQIEGEDNPQSKKSFIKEKLIAWVKSNVRSWEANRDADTARESAISDVDENVSITVE